MNVCKGICALTEVRIPWCRDPYGRGLRRCRRCEAFFGGGARLCPCCGAMLGGRPRGGGRAGGRRA